MFAAVAKDVEYNQKPNEYVVLEVRSVLQIYENAPDPQSNDLVPVRAALVLTLTFD